MTKAIALALLCGALALLNGCKQKPPTFHVTFADPCARPSVTGTIAGKEYALNVEHPPLYIACPGPLRMRDVGKDFPVKVDIQREKMTIELPSGAITLEIDSVREVK